MCAAYAQVSRENARTRGRAGQNPLRFRRFRSRNLHGICTTLLRGAGRRIPDTEFPIPCCAATAGAGPGGSGTGSAGVMTGPSPVSCAGRRRPLRRCLGRVRHSARRPHQHQYQRTGDHPRHARRHRRRVEPRTEAGSPHAPTMSARSTRSPPPTPPTRSATSPPPSRPSSPSPRTTSATSNSATRVHKADHRGERRDRPRARLAPPGTPGRRVPLGGAVHPQHHRRRRP